MNCENCKDEYCHVCKIGVDPIGWIELRMLPANLSEEQVVEIMDRIKYTGVIYLTGTGDDERNKSFHSLMNNGVPYGFIPFDNSFEHDLSNCFDKHLSGDELHEKMLDARSEYLLREK